MNLPFSLEIIPNVGVCGHGRPEKIVILASKYSYLKPIFVYFLKIKEVFKVYVYFHGGFRQILSKSRTFAPKIG